MHIYIYIYIYSAQARMQPAKPPNSSKVAHTSTKKAKAANGPRKTCMLGIWAQVGLRRKATKPAKTSGKIRNSAL